MVDTSKHPKFHHEFSALFPFSDQVSQAAAQNHRGFGFAPWLWRMAGQWLVGGEWVMAVVAGDEV